MRVAEKEHRQYFISQVNDYEQSFTGISFIFRRIFLILSLHKLGIE